MDIKAPQIYEKLKALEIVDLDPKEFPDEELFRGLQMGLMSFKITAADFDKPLTDEKRLGVLGGVDYAVADVAGRTWRDNARAPAVQTLSGIRSLSSLLLSATRPKDMGAGPAKAYYEGHGSHQKHFSDTLSNVSDTSPPETRSIRYDGEGGPGYYVRQSVAYIREMLLQILTPRRELWTPVVTLQTAEENCLISLTRQLAKTAQLRRSLTPLAR
jgi:hypothetical protein